MKKIICVLGIASIISMGTFNSADAQTYTTTKARKVWSHTAKGAVIGAGSGAVIGALVNKNNRVGGAAVGSVVGAGLGYLVGRHQDKVNPQPKMVYKTKTYNASRPGRPVHVTKKYSYKRPRVVERSNGYYY